MNSPRTKWASSVSSGCPDGASIGATGSVFSGAVAACFFFLSERLGFFFLRFFFAGFSGFAVSGSGRLSSSFMSPLKVSLGVAGGSRLRVCASTDFMKSRRFGLVAMFCRSNSA